MKQSVIKQVAENNSVSEDEVRKEITEALSFAKGFDEERHLDIEEVITLLASEVSKALEKN